MSYNKKLCFENLCFSPTLQLQGMGLGFPLCSCQLLRPDLELAGRLAV